MSNPKSLIMIPNKIKLILSILFMSCSFVTDSKDSENTANPLVGTWNMTTVEYFETLDCSGVPDSYLDFSSQDDLAELGLDEYQLKVTITIDLHVIVIRSTSLATSNVREEVAATGILVDHGDKYCVIWDTAGTDGCDECKDYTINGDELEFLTYNCLPPVPTDDNIPCQIYTLVKE